MKIENIRDYKVTWQFMNEDFFDYEAHKIIIWPIQDNMTL